MSTTTSVAYFIIMFAALATCGLLLRRWQAELPLTRLEKLGIGIGAFCGAMIGAKLPFLFSDWDAFHSGAAWFAHGKTIVCGIVGGYLGVEVAKWTLEIRVKTGDSFAAPAAIGVAIGRLACFTAGCCYGTPTDLPWGVTFSTALDNARRHPTQIYESIFHLACAVALIVLQRQGRFRGQLIKLYILTYLSYRFLSEFIRPEPALWYGLTGYQWATLTLAPLFVWLWIRDQRRFASQKEEPVLST